MQKVQFVVDAKKYFEVDAERLERVQVGDLIFATIDFEKKKAEYVWFGAGENPANFPSETDDFDGVVELWERLGCPQMKG